MPKIHGQRRTPGYASWASMMRRCYNPSQQNYGRYGGAGIRVDDSWHNAKQFLADMGQPPLGYTLDRIDSRKGYSKNNCRWATREEQNANRRHVQKLADGRVAARVAAGHGISADTFHRRVHRGWTLLEAATHPVNVRRTKKVEV